MKKIASLATSAIKVALTVTAIYLVVDYIKNR